ncbi:uncharacterized protein E6C27_scaffold270G002530 [Cucumis melo var. makuwa]|uniref:Envelope-like protein n=1 Tax=Cucumis melo var. makuwa TaxID=1194695 RepID=A0A5A7T4T2_CUCMM|nr:uncharacterized protein E6C27_scaffold270G002530 [Cucumis melo var. makuwa]
MPPKVIMSLSMKRLLKKGFASNVTPTKFVDPVILARSQESSSEVVFIPTPGLHRASNDKPCPSQHSPPIRSSILDDVPTSSMHSELAPVSINEFITTEGRTDVPTNETLDDDNVEPTNISTTNTVEPDVNNDFQLDVNNDFQPETQQSSEIPSNIPSVPSSSDYQTIHISGLKFKISPAVINGFLGSNVESDCSSSNPSNEVLASELSKGTISSWPINGIPTVDLDVKYAILHKIVLPIGSHLLMLPVCLLIGNISISDMP